MNELILVIEDEKEIQELIRYNLQRVRFRVATDSNGDDGLRTLFSSKPDLVVLDLMLPGSSGLEVLREIRNESAVSETPVIILTARSDEMDRLVGFEQGADDYLTKPFSPKELIARIRAILRRTQPKYTTETIDAGDLRVDTMAHEATFRSRKLTLTRREFELLAFLAHHPGRVFSREELLRRVWGYNFVGETRTVDVHIRRLRKKVGEDNRIIDTVTGAGYKFIKPSAQESS
jgi:two-component system alkaline phosphatase synthesis response regulator PhoP